MRRIASIAGIAAFVLAAGGTALAATPPGPPAPSADTMWHLQMEAVLEQARGPDIRPETTRALMIDELLNRLYRGDPVAPQEIEQALR